MVTSTLDYNAGPVFGGVHADLEPFAELADCWGPGLVVVGDVVVEEEMGGGCGGVLNQGSGTDCVYLEILSFVFGHVSYSLLGFWALADLAG